MTDWKLIWNDFCDDVAKSVKKNDVERYFEKNIAKELLSACGWGKYSGLMEQYTIGFATTSGKADFALVPNKDSNPDVIIELKRPKNKKRDIYTTQLHDYMKQKECDFGILMLGTQMEVYYREHSVFELIDVIKYEHDNESAHYLIDLLTRDNFTTERVRDYCHDRVVVNKKIDYWSSSEGVKRMKEMAALADDDLTGKQRELLKSSLHLAITRQAGKTKEVPAPVLTPGYNPNVPFEEKNGPQATWLICYDKNAFEVSKCFDEQGQVFWKHKSTLKKVKTGDIAYLYSNSPDSCIRYKVEITDSQLPYSPVMDVEDKYSKTGEYNSSDKSLKFFIVKALGKTTSKALTLTAMQKQKLVGGRLTATNLSQEAYRSLLTYIEDHFYDNDEVLIPPTKVNKAMPKGKGIVFTQELKKAGGHCKMTYYREEKKFVINKGGDILENSSESSCPKAMIEFREQIKADKTLSRKEGKLYKLLEDIVIPQSCSTPSGASQFCWGTSRPGPDDWKDESGKSYPTKWWKE